MGAANPCVISTVIVTCIFVIGAICVLQAGSVAVVKPQYNAGCSHRVLTAPSPAEPS